MIDSIKKNTHVPMLILGCLQPFVPEEFFSLLGILILFGMLMHRNLRIKITKSAFEMMLCFLFLFGAVIGIHNILSNLHAYIRDMYYFLNPIVFILIGINLIKDTLSFKKILNTVLSVSIIVALINILQMFVGLATGGTLINLRSYYEYVMWGCAVSLGGILVLWNEESIMGKHKKMCFVFLVIVLLLGLSRTVWIEAVIIVFTVTLIGQNKSKATKRLAIICIVVLALLTISLKIVPESQITTITDKLFNSLTEINASNDWTTKASIQANWRGYEMHCAIQQFKNSSIFSQLFGGGFGTGIEVGRYASLVAQSGTVIYVIHNGFYGMLLKEGIIGLAVYIILFAYQLITSYKATIKSHSKYDALVFGTTICLIIYTYLVKGIMADFVQFNALIIIGSWLRWKRFAK